MEEIRCRICDSAISLAGTLGRRVSGGTLAVGPEVELENDGNGYYFMCPYCSARNFAIVMPNWSGPPAVQVAWAVMNGD